MCGGLIHLLDRRGVVRVGIYSTRDASCSTRLGGRLWLISVPRKENAKDTLCRNVTIYGHCRYEDKGGRFPNQVLRNKRLMQR